MKVSFSTQAYTVIFKDGTTATFENAIRFKKKVDKLEIFYVCDNNLECEYYDYNDVATVAQGIIDILI